MSRSILVAFAATSLVACTSHNEHAARDALAEQPAPAEYVDAKPDRPFDGQLPGYVKYAAEHSPRLRALYEDWQAAAHSIDRHKRLPDPQFRYTAFLRRIETRVGPQRHRFGLSQQIPWPSKLTAGAEAASLGSQARGRLLDAEVLHVTREVATVYWELWLVARERKVLHDQIALSEAMVRAAEGRIEVGKATLADHSQASLVVSRLTDRLEALQERRTELEASLRAFLGVAPDTPVPVSEEAPRVVLPAEPASALQDAARKHPSYEALGLMAGSREREADSAFAEGLPSFMLGFDYIEIGEAAMATPESGKDAVSVTVGVTLPLWTWAYDDKEGQLRAEGRAFEARRTASARDAVAEVDRSLARIRDAHRRVRLYRSTLIPQAETAYEGALAGYATGDGGLAPVLLAQRELLSLSIELFRAQAMHARAWARLEEVVGRKVAAGEGA